MQLRTRPSVSPFVELLWECGVLAQKKEKRKGAGSIRCNQTWLASANDQYACAEVEAQLKEALVMHCNGRPAIAGTAGCANRS
jgi:hypothetical protein